jgi:GNAT superfamily N-acetyltransferase
LYTAISWNDDPNIPPLEVAVQHPDVVRYHEGWGRAGDIGVKAIMADELVGAAFARLFTDEDHGHGFVDSETPELGIGVVSGHRGKGIGRELMLGLAEKARAEGIHRLSLSVNNPNPAKRLYESLGYTTVQDDGASSVMVLVL